MRVVVHQGFYCITIVLFLTETSEKCDGRSDTGRQGRRIEGAFVCVLDMLIVTTCVTILSS